MRLRFLVYSFLFVLVAQNTLAQDVFVDPRDHQKYSVVRIRGNEWMAENLNFETPLSVSSEPQQEKNPKLTGRYYHLEEICCVCPDGWRLPDLEDWLNYFSFMVKSVDSLAPLKYMGDERSLGIGGYNEKVNLFADDNPLQLTGTGMVEGKKFINPENIANYWTLDPPEWSHDLDHSKQDHIHVLPLVYDGKTHIHIRNNGFSNIHSHDHHLNPKNKKKLRKFMVRCVRE